MSMYALAPRSIFWCVPPGLRRTLSEPIPFSTRYVGDRRKLHRVGSSPQAPPSSVGAYLKDQLAAEST
uniref:Uncharacterized protein n=1 Tax=Rhizobium loti TaxID=381 RepID=M5B2P8_RHILI|nr:conserved hypothetical protein [Mesorhizobium loti NZP2037]